MTWSSSSSRTPAASAKPRGAAAVDQHVLLARGPLGLAHRCRSVGHISDQRPLGDVDAGLTAGDDEDRKWMVAAPAASRLESPPTGDDRPGGHHLVEDLAVDPRLTRYLLVVRVGTRQDPVVQAVPTVAKPVVGSYVGPGDEAVEGHGHVVERLRTRAFLPGPLPFASGPDEAVPILTLAISDRSSDGTVASKSSARSRAGSKTGKTAG